MKGISRKIFTLALSFFFTVALLFNDYKPTNAAVTTKTYAISDYKVSNVYSGFKLISIKDMAGINSKVMEFTHMLTGAKLVFVKNDDNERVFSISFRTPPSDDTGVNHIIEHSVLDGSKKYPEKSPFADMLKSSLGSFINAMTTSDYTIFPVSSTNEKDLQNLMSVYLDAVFYPNFNSQPNIFKQEGWRYELNSESSKLALNGVVYNEMSTYYSNPTWIMNSAINKSLFPDTSYKWNSGGNPASIPNLTREKFIATHNKNYTPSNSYVFLYGNLDISKYLEYINDNYFSKFSRINNNTNIKIQKPFSQMVEKTVDYSIAKNADTKGKAYISLNFVAGNIVDKELSVGMDYLNYLLMGQNSSPLKKALMESTIAQNVYSTYNQQGIQPVLTITAENTDEALKLKFQNIITEELTKISKNGFEKNYLNASFTQYDLTNRMSKLMPMKGLSLAMNAMKTWIYGKDPTIYFDTRDTMEKIKKLASNGYFENLITKYLLDNKHKSLIVLNPVPGLENTIAEGKVQKLDRYKGSIDSKDILSLINDTVNFKAWQEAPDSKESLASVPRLAIKDIKPELPDVKMNVSDEMGIKVISHNVNLNGVSSINLYFNTSKVPQEKLHYLKLLSTLLGNVNTKKYNYQELLNETSLYTSGIYFGAMPIQNSINPDIYYPKMSVSLNCVDNNISKALGIVEEIINNSTSDNKARVKQLVDQNFSMMKQMYTFGTGILAINRMGAYFSETGRYNEALGGIGYYRFLEDLSKNFDNRWSALSGNLKETSMLVFNKNGLIASQSGDINTTEVFKKELKSHLIDKLNNKVLAEQKYSFGIPEKNTAFKIPVKVQTIIKVGNFAKEGYVYSGKMLVLQRLLTMDYLWNKVRATGGAYSVNAAFGQDGTALFMSASDPNIVESLDAFNGVVEYLKNFNATKEEMDNYIIGTIGDFLKLKSMGPLYEGSIGESLYLSGSSPEDLLKMQNEALSTTAQDIRDYAVMIEKILKQDAYFVEGSDTKIDENKNIFNKIEVIGN